MISAIRNCLLVFAAMALTAVSFSQMGMGRPPDIPGVFKPVVGSGAAYEIVTKNGTKTNLEISIVGQESGGYWMEVSNQVPQMNGAVYAKELMVRQGDDLIIQRMILQMPGRPPMDVSSMPHSVQSQKEKADYRANAQDMGVESVTTPAGTFSCHHWRDTKDENDYWLSDKVLPWQLVKMTGKNTTSITLVRTITDAKTHITGSPMSMQELMQQHMNK
jgi:hypothetical protein